MSGFEVVKEWNRVFYLDITELYQNLFITLYDEDENDADDFMGKLCVPILEMKGQFKVFLLKRTKVFIVKHKIRVEFKVSLTDLLLPF